MRFSFVFSGGNYGMCVCVDICRKFCMRIPKVIAIQRYIFMCVPTREKDVDKFSVVVFLIHIEPFIVLLLFLLVSRRCCRACLTTVSTKKKRKIIMFPLSWLLALTLSFLPSFSLYLDYYKILPPYTPIST